MKLLGLISGGKDSLYNLHECVAAGHEIIALANLYPDQNEGKDDLESWMFQTVGHEGISLIAKAMELPLFRLPTKGISNCRNLNYTPTDADEVEDLQELIKLALTKYPEINGVAVGAILSDYQRLRVEHICSQLQLTSVAYLWQRDQKELFDNMIDNQIDAIFIKVSSFRLMPEHLGKHLPELRDILHEHVTNICGEGGEYETFVLDCPLFKRRIVVIESEVVIVSWNEFAPVAYLKLNKLDLVEKKIVSELKLPSKPEFYVIKYLRDLPQCENLSINELKDTTDAKQWNIERFTLSNPGDMIKREIIADLSSGWSYIPCVSGVTLDEVITKVSGLLTSVGCLLNDAVYVTLWLRSMSAFNDINETYKNHFLGKSIPARACISSYLPKDVNLQMEVVANKQSSSDKSCIHVQSISHWAPANIGPYSQCITVNDIAYTSGQIAMIPGTLSLLNTPSVLAQLKLALNHAKTILKAQNLDIENYCILTVYFSSSADIGFFKSRSLLNSMFREFETTCVVFVVVNELPKSAAVECQIVADKNRLSSAYLDCQNHRISCFDVEMFSITTKKTKYLSAVFQWNGENTLCELTNEIVDQFFESCISTLASNLKQVISLRIFYPWFLEDLRSILEHLSQKRRLDNCVLSLLPVNKLESSHTIITVTGICHLVDRNT